jgi:excisionase family DNA binding protein
MNIGAGEEFLTITEVQGLLKVSRTFAYSLVERGELPSYRVGSKLLRVRRRDVERWLEENRCVAGK